MSFAKDKIPPYQTANVIYKINCPACGKDYIGKSERCFGIRMECHGKRENEPMCNHLRNCTQFHEICNLLVIDDEQDNRSIDNMNKYIYNAVFNNSKIIKRHKNLTQLSFMEAYYIKLNNQAINWNFSKPRACIV